MDYFDFTCSLEAIAKYINEHPECLDDLVIAMHDELTPELLAELQDGV